jgi:hypothetical protein
VQFNVHFNTPLALTPGDHIFFRPEVDFGSAADFLWLSAPKPIVPPGTPFANPAQDLQSWTRNDGAGALAPDWSRIGTDITGQGPFNAAFELFSTTGGSFFFSTGNPDGLMATLSRTASAGKLETETADDFIVPAGITSLSDATFIGLVVLPAPEPASLSLLGRRSSEWASWVGGVGVVTRLRRASDAGTRSVDRFEFAVASPAPLHAENTARR